MIVAERRMNLLGQRGMIVRVDGIPEHQKSLCVVLINLRLGQSTTHWRCDCGSAALLCPVRASERPWLYRGRMGSALKVTAEARKPTLEAHRRSDRSVCVCTCVPPHRGLVVAGHRLSLGAERPAASYRGRSTVRDGERWLIRSMSRIQIDSR